MSDCICPVAGYCERYKRRMVGRVYELCRDRYPSGRPRPAEVKRRNFLLDLARKAGLPAVCPPRAPAAKRGPGAELTAAIGQLGFRNGCWTCAALADRMDEGGVAWCREHETEILAQLREAQKKLGWLDTLKAAAAAVTTGLAFRLDPLDPAPGLLAEALRRWEAKEADARTPE